MSSNQKKILVIAIIVVVIIVIAIIVKNKGNDESEASIIDNSIEVTAVEREDRIENAINSAISRIEKAGMTAIKQRTITLGEASGYSYIVDGTTIEIYYLEPVKLEKIVEKDSNNENATITIDGQTRDALVYTNIFILNCDSTTLKDKLDSALGQNNMM